MRRVADDDPRWRQSALGYGGHAAARMAPPPRSSGNPGVGAAGLALQDSGISMENENPERVGVVVGTGIVPVDVPEIMPMLQRVVSEDGSFDLKNLDQNSSTPLFPLWLLRLLPNMISAHISMMFNAQGPNSTVTTACVAGTQAVGEGFRMVARGEADLVIAGGSDSRLDPLLLMAYTALGTLSRRTDLPPEQVSRPFDRMRDGFVLGEGAGILILEDLERARRRGAATRQGTAGGINEVRSGNCSKDGCPRQPRCCSGVMELS